MAISLTRPIISSGFGRYVYRPRPREFLLAAWNYGRDTAYVHSKRQLTKQKKAARELADIFYAALQNFPEEKQEEKVQEFRKIIAEVSV
jgi:hypothetical protein